MKFNRLVANNLYPSAPEISRRADSIQAARERRNIRCSNVDAIRIAEKQLISERTKSAEHNKRKAAEMRRLASLGYFKVAAALP